jgi:hypothetical protein
MELKLWLSRDKTDSNEYNLQVEKYPFEEYDPDFYFSERYFAKIKSKLFHELQKEIRLRPGQRARPVTIIIKEGHD